MKADEIFEGISDFRAYVDGIEADTTYDSLRPSIRSSASMISSIVGKPVFNALADSSEDGKELMKAALATSALYSYQIFISTKKNNTDGKFYKYQHEEIKEHHISAFWSAMDELLDWLDDNIEDNPLWKESDMYRIRQSLPVRNAAQFDSYYGIDRSSYFYSKVLFLLRTIWAENIKPALGKIEPDEDLMERCRRVLCYWTVAEAVMKFDITELPRSIRYDYNHEYTKGSSPQGRDRLYADLMSKVNAWMKMIESSVKSLSGNDVFSEPVNSESNKFYLM